MTTAPPAGYASNTSPPLAVSEFTYHNTSSPPSVPVVNLAITGTTYSVTRELWNATLDVYMTWTNLTSLLSSTSLNLLYPTPTVSNGYSRGSLLPCTITLGPCPPPPGYKKLSKPRPSPPAQTVSRPMTVPKVVLQRIEVPQGRRSPSPTSPRPSRKRRWLSPSPSRHSSCARYLCEVEVRICELEREVQRLTPRITAAASELQALCESVAQLKRGK